MKLDKYEKAYIKQKKYHHKYYLKMKEKKYALQRKKWGEESMLMTKHSRAEDLFKR
jgi:hypothetical protein